LGKKWSIGGGLDALVASNDDGSLAYRQPASETVGATMNVDALDGEGQELEEGEIADTMEIAERRPMQGEELEEGEIAASPSIDILGVMNTDTSYAEGQELEEGEITPAMDTAEFMNEDTLNGVVDGQEFEEGEITTTMNFLESTNTFHGAVEVPDLEEGEIAATMCIAESANKESSDGTVKKIQELEEGVIVATMDVVESMNNQSLDGVVVAQKLEESEIVGMDTVEDTNKDTFVGPVEDWELECEIVAKGHGQEPDDGEIVAKGHDQEPGDGKLAAKGHGQEPDDGKLATKSDRIVQQSVNVKPCGSTSGTMRSKIRLTPRKTVRPPVIVNDTMSQLVPLRRPLFATTATVKKLKAAQTEPAKANQTMPQLVPLRRPLFTTTATVKKFEAAETKPVPINLASASASASKDNRKFKYMFITEEKLKGKRAVYLEDDDILKAVAVHEGKLELCLGVPSSVLSVSRHRKHGGGQKADPRRRVGMMCRRFEFLCRFLAQAVKQRSMELRRIDLAADQVIKKLPDYRKHGSIMGKVAGVEVGDEFLFRVELAIVGLHNPFRAGIDTTKDTDGEPIAVSIVASGGYLDEFSSSGDLVYTGSGGKAGGADQDGDQKLERGNLALRNCIKREIPVRVTHGFKSQDREEGSHSKGKEISKFIYDGLYHVVSCWQEGVPGSRVLKYRLRRIPGQPELPLNVAKWLRKSARS
jgi:euchromatic histone-lysine N-methyltransferase